MIRVHHVVLEGEIKTIFVLNGSSSIRLSEPCVVYNRSHVVLDGHLGVLYWLDFFIQISRTELCRSVYSRGQSDAWNATSPALGLGSR